MSRKHWDVWARDPQYLTWIEFEDSTGQILAANTALISQNNPFRGRNVTEFLAWFNFWYHNAQVQETDVITAMEDNWPPPEPKAN